jgi:ATP-dependent RNA helicase SUPV3L1/SUV3
MDVDHVAFARHGKFDGHQPRPLTAAEVAQIAGRAGRGMRDGTFGTTADCPPFGADIVGAVEAHSFERLAALCWRNSDLDFTGVDALLAALNAPPPGPGLVRGNDASDLQTLTALAHEPQMRALARGRRRVRLLWEACQIPDFRKLADDSHVRLCGRVFGHIARESRLPPDWLASQIALLDRVDGDIDTLMQRLAGVRVWSYIAARADWVADAAHWQGRTREVEDKLSDALHESLTARFVDRRAALLMRRLEAGSGADLLSAVTRRGEVVVEGQAVGHIDGFGFVPEPMSDDEGRRLVLRAARRALRDEMPLRVVRLEAEPDAAFAWLPTQRIAWGGAAVARLKPGPEPLRPLVEVLASEFLDGAARERVRARLQRFVDDQVHSALAPLVAAVAAADAEGETRGPLHRLVEAMGVVPGATEHDIPPPLRSRLKELGVRAGRHALFLPALLKPRAAAMRALLWALRQDVPTPELPAPALVTLPPPAAWPAGFAAAMGWVRAGPVLVRLDVAERVSAEVAYAARGRPAALPADLASRLAVKPELVPAVLRGLGFHIIPAAAADAVAFGPPMPALVMALRHRTAPAHPAGRRPPAADHPFAALAALRG